MPIEGLPLKLGDRGPLVRDLHRRLAKADCPVAEGGDEFTDATREAVAAFQTSRRLEVDGECGPHTWSALDEAAHRLGDRLLYLQAPMLRGDDVARLQQRLGALGFDAGRVDGILGPDTARALESFQRNAGLPVDGIFGPDSLDALNRLGGRENQQSVTAVRERERLRALAAQVRERRIVLGELGGLGIVADTFARALRPHVGHLDVIAHPDGSHRARVANQLDADLYLGVVADEKPRCTISYFATEGFESEGGLHLARLLLDALDGVIDAPEIQGRRLPVLRETRMPAVVLRIGPTPELVHRAPLIADAAAEAVRRWLQEPVGDSA